MTLKSTAITSLTVALTLRLYIIAAGWNADPIFLFNLATPYVVLPLAIYSLLIAPLCLPWLWLMRSSGLSARTRASAAVAVLLAAVIAAPTPLLPKASDAFEWRMKSFSEVEFQEFSSNLRSEMSKIGLVELSGRDDASHNEIVESLKRDHSILRLNTFPLELFVGKGYVTIEWASGLTGGHEVTITDGEGRPRWVPPPNVYSNVSAYSE